MSNLSLIISYTNMYNVKNRHAWETCISSAQCEFINSINNGIIVYGYKHGFVEAVRTYTRFRKN